jgi:peptide/nickel transport system substrate-binding protein
MIKDIENELTAVDDRIFRWILKKPYPKLLLALGKIGTPCCHYAGSSGRHRSVQADQ